MSKPEPMKRISIVSGPYETEDFGFEIDDGFLVAPSIAMFIYDGRLYITRVSFTQLPRVYTQHGAMTSLGKADRGEILINEVYEKLTTMTAFDFVARYVLSNDSEIEFNLTK